MIKKVKVEKGVSMPTDELNVQGMREMPDAQKEAICYKSKLLNKYFDNYEDLVAEETAVIKAEEEKKLKAEAKKAEATKVEEAYKCLNAAKKAYNEQFAEARKLYLEAISKAKHEYSEALNTVEQNLSAAEDNYKQALDEFTKAHPEGFHMTLKDGDNVTTISRSSNHSVDAWDNFFDAFFKLF